MQHQAVVRTHIDELLSDAQVYLDSDGMRAISRAVEMAVEFHTGQTRKFDGSPYVLHPLRIARTILTWGFVTPSRSVLRCSTIPLRMPLHSFALKTGLRVESRGG